MFINKNKSTETIQLCRMQITVLGAKNSVGGWDGGGRVGACCEVVFTGFRTVAM